MAKTAFRHARMTGITAVVPETCINIDDEIAFFNNDRALLDRNKKILGLGTRHVVDDGVAVSDLLAAAADRLFEGVNAILILMALHPLRPCVFSCSALSSASSLSKLNPTIILDG